MNTQQIDEKPAENLALGAEFPAASRAQWLKLVENVLKGAAFDKKLVSRTYDGLRIEPLYDHAGTAYPVAGRVPGKPWQIVQRVEHPDPAEANKQALHDLENGATGLSLVFAGSIGAYGYGLPPGAAALARVLDGIYLDALIGIDLDLSVAARETPLHVAALVKTRKLDPAKVQLRAGLDPVRSLAAEGASPLDWPELAALLAKLCKDLLAAGFSGPFAVADGRVVHNAGGSEAQELGYVLASAIAYLRALTEAGIPLDTARRLIAFRMSADADQFLTMAKFRAVRKLWARVEQACGATPAPVHVTAETAWRMTTQRDPNVNMLRATIATLAAGLAGADAISVLPFTAALGLPDAFARRVARNTQLVLLEESNLARVADPAAGAGGIEALTDQLAAAAWGLMQEIEAAGGICAALTKGLVQEKVARVRSERMAALAKRKDALTGASEFPDIHAAPAKVLDVPRVIAHAGPAAKIMATPLPAMRLAQPFEALRDASDRALAETGARPKVFIASLGRPADFLARATFAKNLFEAGGIEAVMNDGFARADGKTDLAALAAAYRAAQAGLVCLASSDALYAEEAIAAAEALAQAAAQTIYLAGRPGELEAQLIRAGVQGFVYVGCDVLATLREAHARLGLTP